MLAVTQ